MNRIKDLRKAQIPKMSQEKLANIVGVGRTTVTMWENGSNEPDNATLIKLADLFGVSADYLLGRDKQEKNPPPEDRGGPSKTAQRFMTLVDGLTPDQQQLLLAQLQAWNEQNQKQSLADRLSGGEKGPKSDS